VTPMTLTSQVRAGSWSATPVNAHDHPLIADFLATTGGLPGRKFGADSRDVAEQLAGAFPGGATMVRDDTGRVRGYVVLNRPHGRQPEVLADYVLGPDVPPHFVDDVVAATVARFTRERASNPDLFLRSIVGAGQQSVLDALIRRGAVKEADFARTRKPLQDEDPRVLRAASVDGVRVLGWPEVLDRDLGEQVRRLQYDTFLEHFGNMSKTPEDWQQHIESRSFAPDFSVAALDSTGTVVGYVLGSIYTDRYAGSVEHSAHTDYIGVRRDQRKNGIGELLLRKIWLAAVNRGLSVASLGTDVNNRSNAHLLYRRLGYQSVEHSSAYRLDGFGERCSSASARPGDETTDGFGERCSSASARPGDETTDGIAQ
jgi:ribosomal protein S18 acetylase RimI-like enzyme